ncbi:catalase [Mesorhizobium sp. BH1-1-5]|uniref:catalase n=1 Tax=Mesorhizobium sp. BH1-1-5 TaxID=2876661 RepID=UPI001CCBCDC4|nr:catalase [Mesorhizobium sp. BH1-1-5]MBZ9988168.1 catalase [Mesorhizobium sp. BH1-1-5]
MSQNSQYRSADTIVDRIHGVLGHYPGYRTLHADGRLYKGVFRAYDAAKRFTRAIHLQGQEIPITVRFSKGGGNPHAFFNATVGMATRFYLPDGRVTNIVMLSQKLFFANTIEQFVGLVNSAQPSEPGGGINKAGLDAFLAANPNVMNVFKMRAAAQAPVSFGNTEFHAVHVFRYINASGEVTHVRCHWIPLDGVKGQDPESLTHESVDVLFDEMSERLKSASAEFELELEIGQDGDPLNDATALWPDGRDRVRIGRLTVTTPTTEAEIGDLLMNHDPTMLVDGIEATDDPILQIRRGVYEASAAQRSGGWQAQAAKGAQTGG